MPQYQKESYANDGLDCLVMPFFWDDDPYAGSYPTITNYKECYETNLKPLFEAQNA